MAQGPKKKRRKDQNQYLEKVKNNSYIKIPTDIQEAIYKSDLGKNERKILDFIIRKTWGWNKDREVIRVRTFSQELSLDKALVSKALTGLQKKKVVDKLSTKLWQIQLDTAKWKTIKKQKPKKKKKKPKKTDYNRDRGKFVDKKSTLIKSQQNVDKLSTSVDKLSTSVDKLSTTKPEEYSKNTYFKTPKETSLTDPIKKKQQQQQEKEKTDVAAADISLLQNLKTNLKTDLKTWGLSDAKINKLLKILIANGHTDINEHINLWIEHINRIQPKNPAGFLITMIENNENPPMIESPSARKLRELKEEEKEKLLKQAKIELGRLSSKKAILSWLEKLPESYHQKLKRYLDYKYWEHHSYREAKEEWLQKPVKKPDKYEGTYEEI